MTSAMSSVRSVAYECNGICVFDAISVGKDVLNTQATHSLSKLFNLVRCPMESSPIQVYQIVQGGQTCHTSSSREHFVFWAVVAFAW